MKEYIKLLLIIAIMPLLLLSIVSIRKCAIAKQIKKPNYITKTITNEVIWMALPNAIIDE